MIKHNKMLQWIGFTLLAGGITMPFSSSAAPALSANQIQQLFESHSWSPGKDDGQIVYSKGRYFIYDKNGRLSDYGRVDYHPAEIDTYNANGTGNFKVTVNSEGNVDLNGSVTTDMMTLVTTPLEMTLQPLKTKRTLPSVATIFDAAMYGDNEYIEKFTGDVNQKDQDGNTALISASYSPFYNTVELLLKKGAQVNVISGNDKTPLMLAVEAGVPQSVAALIQAGADVNFENKDKETVLSKAAEGDNLDVLKLLVTHGANLTVLTGIRGDSILETAMSRLSDAGAGFTDNLSFTQYLVQQAGFKINTYLDRSGQTALYQAVMLVLPKTVNYLLEQGANPNFQDANKDTPLTWAIEQNQGASSNDVLNCELPGFLDSVRELHTHGANFALKNSDGQDALALAQSSGCTKLAALIQSLQKTRPLL